MTHRSARFVAVTVPTWGRFARAAQAQSAGALTQQLHTPAGASLRRARLPPGLQPRQTESLYAGKVAIATRSQGAAMKNHRFDSLEAQRDTRWAMYLAPIPFVLALFGAAWLLPSMPEPADMLALHALPIATEPSAAGPAPAARPVQDWPAPASASQIAEQPSTF